MVGSDRPTFLSIRSGCSDSPNRSSGMLQRAALIKALAHTAVDIKVGVVRLGSEEFLSPPGSSGTTSVPSASPVCDGACTAHKCRAQWQQSTARPPALSPHPACTQADCTCAVCPDSLPHDALQAELRSSLFCPVLAGDTAASNRLSEVVLAGA